MKMLVLRTKKENFEQIMGAYFKVCGLLHDEFEVAVKDVTLNEDTVDLTVETKVPTEALN